MLSALDAPLLADLDCWFGGGTAIALANHEYRESADIDFLVSDAGSYRSLREIVKRQGLDGLATRELATLRPPAIDGYGIRAAVLQAGTAIKFEIVLEGRIELDTPAPTETISGVRVLTRTDQVATKLLANDDRWPDTSTFSRDLIDLAMMRPDAADLEAGAAKAVAAYGMTLGESLHRAIEHLRERPQRLAECVSALQMDASPAAVWQQIRELAAACSRTENLGQAFAAPQKPSHPCP